MVARSESGIAPHTPCGELRLARTHGWPEADFDARRESQAKLRPRVEMTSAASAPATAIRESAALARRFEAIVLDWDRTDVPDRRADATRVGKLVEEACAHGLELAIVSGTDVEEIDGKLAARPAGPGGFVLALNRGSEVYSVDRDGPRLVFRRTATAEENAALSRAVQLTVDRFEALGLRARIASEPLNRRKIAARIARRPEAMKIAREAAAEAGLADARVSCDARHLEIGLTDKSDSGQVDHPLAVESRGRARTGAGRRRRSRRRAGRRCLAGRRSRRVRCGAPGPDRAPPAR